MDINSIVIVVVTSKKHYKFEKNTLKVKSESERLVMSGKFQRFRWKKLLQCKNEHCWS